MVVANVREEDPADAAAGDRAGVTQKHWMRMYAIYDLAGGHCCLTVGSQEVAMK